MVNTINREQIVRAQNWVEMGLAASFVLVSAVAVPLASQVGNYFCSQDNPFNQTKYETICGLSLGVVALAGTVLLRSKSAEVALAAFNRLNGTDFTKDSMYHCVRS